MIFIRIFKVVVFIACTLGAFIVVFTIPVMAIIEVVKYIIFGVPFDNGRPFLPMDYMIELPYVIFDKLKI